MGLGSKAAARVLRLQRARRMPAAGRGQAETAAVCGFYDQAHLSGEFKAMTGCTPGEFAAARQLPPRCSCRRRTGSGARRRGWCWRPHVAGVRAVRFFQDRRAPIRAG
ncbi:helix-turn-helix domain-containing protein [Streptomyces sp. NPDC054794]